MDFLLVNPFVTDFACYDYWMKPLGLLYLSAILKKEGHRVEFLDCMDRHHADLPPVSPGSYGRGGFFSLPRRRPEVLKKFPRKYKSYGLSGEKLKKTLEVYSPPDYILLTSGMSYWYPGVAETASLLREKFPRARVILGGIYASLCPGHARENVPADLVLSGPGFSGLEEVTGVSIPPFTGYPAPDYSGYGVLDYAAVRSSAGCPGPVCPYCAVGRISPGYRFKPSGAVKREIEELRETRGISDIVFYDDALLNSPGFLGYLENPARGVRHHTPNAFEAGKLTAETAELMRRAGFTDPCISLDLVGREGFPGKVNRETAEEAARALRKAGYPAGGFSAYLLAFGPARSLDETVTALEFIHGLGARVRLSEYAVVPGTPEETYFPSEVLSEPLLHNNSLYPAYSPGEWDNLRRVKEYALRLNSDVALAHETAV